MLRTCPACGLDQPADRARCYNCNASLEREPVKAAKPVEAPTEKRARPAELWNDNFKPAVEAETTDVAFADSADSAVQLKRSDATSRLVRGNMANDADSLQPQKRAGRGSSGDPSEIAPPKRRPTGDLGSGKQPLPGAPGTGKYALPAQDQRAQEPRAPGTGKYPLTPPPGKSSVEPTTPLGRPLRQRPPSSAEVPIPTEGPLLDPNRRMKPATGIFAVPPAPVAPPEEESVRARPTPPSPGVTDAVAAANEAAKNRKRLGADDVAEFAHELDDFGTPESGVKIGGAPAAAPPSPGGMPHFLVSQILSEAVPLSTQEPIRIGRSEGNEIVFPISQVSRHHAEVRFDTSVNAYVVVDRNSINGTFVNGKPVKRRKLADGDRIGVGPFTIVYRVSTGGARPRAMDETDVVHAGSLAGELGEMPITDVVRFIEALKKTGELQVIAAPGGERGMLFFREGQPVHAEWKVSLGATAAVGVLRLRAGTFRFSVKAIDIQKPSISATLASLLAEAAKG